MASSRDGAWAATTAARIEKVHVKIYHAKQRSVDARGTLHGQDWCYAPSSIEIAEAYAVESRPVAGPMRIIAHADYQSALHGTQLYDFDCHFCWSPLSSRKAPSTKRPERLSLACLGSTQKWGITITCSYSTPRRSTIRPRSFWSV
jgi:hypothetical protein